MSCYGWLLGTIKQMNDELNCNNHNKLIKYDEELLSALTDLKKTINKILRENEK